MSNVLRVINLNDRKKFPDFRLSIWINFNWICTFWNIWVIPFETMPWTVIFKTHNTHIQRKREKSNNVCRYMRVFLLLVFYLTYSHACPIQRKCLVFSKFLLFIRWMLKSKIAAFQRFTSDVSKYIQCIDVCVYLFPLARRITNFESLFFFFFVILCAHMNMLIDWISLSRFCSHWTRYVLNDFEQMYAHSYASFKSLMLDLSIAQCFWFGMNWTTK